MWKPLTIISILLALTAGSFRYITTKDLQHERIAFADSTANLELVTSYQEDIKGRDTDHQEKTVKETDEAVAQEDEEAKRRKEKGRLARNDRKIYWFFNFKKKGYT